MNDPVRLAALALIAISVVTPSSATVVSAPMLSPAAASRGGASARTRALAVRQAAALFTPKGCKSNGDYDFLGLADQGVSTPSNYAGGGYGTLSPSYAGVASGYMNEACDATTFIGSGEYNVIGGDTAASQSTIVGGSYNTIEAVQGGFIGAGFTNALGAYGSSAIVGGEYNTAAGFASFIGAGGGNSIINSETSYSAEFSSIVGGYTNSIYVGTQIDGAGYSAILGGANNSITSTGTIVNTSAQYGVIGAGQSNTVTGEYGSILGGLQNAVSGSYAATVGGYKNTASGTQAAIGGGYGNIASGKNGTIPGGTTNTAAGTNSFAAGSNSTAGYTGDFVWSDYVDGMPGVTASAPGQFLARATGGFYLYSSKTLTGVALAAGSGAWSTLSDRNVKTGIASIDDASILAKLSALPVSEWSYVAQGTSVRHLGPMAQDFSAAFGLGEDDRHISTVDEEGVALAAIKALKVDNDAKDRQIAELRRAHLADAARLARIETRLDALEKPPHSLRSGVRRVNQMDDDGRLAAKAANAPD